MSEIQGWINLYKPKNISSFKAINKIKKHFSFKKIGHAGTLDPLAEGILPVAIGKTTKLIPFIQSDLKCYKFTVYWGTQTSTDDTDGNVIRRSHIIPNLKDIKNNLNKFIGFNLQTPPKVSAVKINGQRAYILARRNKDFKIPEKQVYVKKIQLLRHHGHTTTFYIECGKGFYIRSFARDIAMLLGTYGHVLSLERVKVGNFVKETSILLDDLLKISERHDLFNCILPSVSMLDDILAYEINDRKDIVDLSFGKSIKIKEDFAKALFSKKNDKKNIFLSSKGDIVSIGRLIGNLFIPYKILI